MMYEYKFYFNSKEFLSYLSKDPELSSVYAVGMELLKADEFNPVDIWVNMKQVLFIAKVEKVLEVAQPEQPTT